MTHIVNELLSWFKAYYSFDIAPRRSDFPKVVFKTGGRDDFDYLARRIARVPERVPLPARFVNPTSGTGGNHVVAE